MIKAVHIQALVIVPLVFWLGGCATAPATSGGAPVEHRSARRAPPPQVVIPLPQATVSQPARPVEVKPLPPPEPLAPLERTEPAPPRRTAAAAKPSPAPAETPAPAEPAPLEPLPEPVAPAEPGLSETVSPAPAVVDTAPVAVPTPAEPGPTRTASVEPAVTGAAPAGLAPAEPPPAEPAPPPAAPLPPAAITKEGDQAVVALLNSADQYVRAGQLDKAGAALERALRIEPRNPGIWHDLGQVRLHQRKYQEAESMFTKSNSLAGNNADLRARNAKYMAAAQQAMGKTAEAGAAARARP